MAGIGFRIEKILRDDTYIASLKAYFYSALICSGPWILSIITIFCLSYFTPKNIDIYEVMYFRTTIIYIFAFSLIVVGLLYLSLNRYLSDKLYQKDEEALIPAFNSSTLFILLLQAVIGYFFFRAAAETPLLAFLSVLIYMVVSMIWLIMIFLTALRDYKAITMAYVAGTAATILASLSLGKAFGLEGYFTGYLIGHLLIVILLSMRIFIEFRSKRIFDWEMFLFLARNKRLVLTGVLYNLAIWIDKMVFWASERSISISSFLRSFPEYDSAVFFAYLTIIPALSLFLIHVETDFYRKYRMFYAQILDKGSYAAIGQAKNQMAQSLRNNIVYLLTFQGMITLLAVTFAPELAVILRLKSMTIPIFRITTLGAFLHSMLIIVIIVILYFDFQGLALGVSALFLATNWLFTLFTTALEVPFLGYGYFLSCLVSLIVAFYLLDFRLRRLEYLTFALQPIGVHREEEIM